MDNKDIKINDIPKNNHITVEVRDFNNIYLPNNLLNKIIKSIPIIIKTK